MQKRFATLLVATVLELAKKNVMTEITFLTTDAPILWSLSLLQTQIYAQSMTTGNAKKPRLESQFVLPYAEMEI